jgi:hypothetical protein
MESHKGGLGVSNWMKAQAPEEDYGVERKRISNFAGFAEDFHEFGRQFALSQIKDTGGKLIPLNYPLDINPVSLSSGAPLAESTVGEIQISQPSFAIRTYAFSVDPGQTISLSFTSRRKNVRVAYRLLTTLAWRAVPQGAASTGEGTLVIPCDDENKVTVALLVTSTDDVDTADALVTVTQVAEDETCECTREGAVSHPWKRGLDRCKPKPVDAGPPVATACKSIDSLPTSDPCLNGHTWRLDKYATQELLEERLNAIPGTMTVEGIDVSGSGTLTVSNQNATFNYQGFTVAYTMIMHDHGTLRVPTTTVLNGAFDSNLFMQGPSEFCLFVYAGRGTAKFTEPFTGGWTFDLGPRGLFVQQEYRMSYTCEPGKLQMHGTYNGSLVFGPFSYTS